MYNVYTQLYMHLYICIIFRYNVQLPYGLPVLQTHPDFLSQGNHPTCFPKALGISTAGRPSRSQGRPNIGNARGRTWENVDVDGD